ncbi:chymotrypsin-elastase inhibitor ixodidin-like isoform X2 [Eleutherodactylus coqui]|uniref:TIL domain-containing protein n=1 Tax=Eleutherodactylus coqui TaxID=57060 RepID=A0A8J6E6T3_ELECQ|nr:hypothetical protein GDO78_018523 [Eleutherodactylus coqui]
MWKLSAILLISASVLQMIDAQDQRPDPRCEENQHWDNCGTRCPARCDIVGRIGMKCPNGCVRGCFCNEGYMFLSGKSGPCVRPEDCPNKNHGYSP